MAKKINNLNASEQLNDATKATLQEVTGAENGKLDTTKPVKSDGSSSAVDASKVKDEVTPKAVFNTGKVAELVSDGSNPASGMGLTLARSAAIPFSGSAGYIGEDKSATVKGTGLTKSGDRPGRTMDTALRHFDDIPAETFTVPIKTIPQLQDGTSAVGYNGNYENEHAVSQKGSGGSPASSKFFRTLDLIEYDNLYFAEGQMNLAEEEKQVIHNWDSARKQYQSDEAAKSFTTGNYLVRQLNVTFDASNNVTKMNFEVDNLSPERYNTATKQYEPKYLTEDEIRAAGDAQIRNRNIMELDRLNMVKQAGDETQSNWSPLGNVIKDPTPTNRMYKEMDAMAGDFAYVSASKLSTALAYQINKARKDGMRKVSPVFEMCEGNVVNSTVRHESYNKENIADIWNATRLANGSAALYIAINDSTPKYNTKSKFLSLPLSFKVALDTAKKNIGSLRMHDTLLKEFNRQETFGKVDEDGSGITPYFISDGAGIILPYDIASTFNNNATILNNKIDPAFNIHYEDMRNVYDYVCYNFFVQGLVDYFVRKASNIRKACNAKADQDFVLHIPVTSTTTCLSLWDLIVCDAMKDIAIERQYALEPVLSYELKNGYPYSGLVGLKDVTIGGTDGVGFTDISSPLQARNIPLNVATRLLLPEVFSPKSAELLNVDLPVAGNNKKFIACQVIMPWYFNQNQFEPINLKVGKSWVLKAGDNASMTFFDSRAGVTFNNMDRILQMDPEQLKLNMDRMIDIPAPTKFVDQTGYGPKAYKYSNSDDGMLVQNYYGFCAERQFTPEMTDQILTIKDVLATPRELGLSMVAPAGIVTPAYDGTNANYRKVSSAYLRFSGPSFRIKYWHVANNISNEIFTDNLLTGQALNFSAHYDVVEATPDRGNDAIGIYIYANSELGGLAYTSEDVIPFKQVTGDGFYDAVSGTYRSGEVTDEGDKCLKLHSILKYLYTRVQIMPFIINPFDSCCDDISAENRYTAINVLDDFDFLHLYNVCGFRAGEYSGIQYDRNRARISLGLGYVSDPYIERRL